MKWYDRRYNHPVYRAWYKLWFSSWNQEPLHAPVQWYARFTRRLGWSNRGEMNYVVLAFLFGVPAVAMLIATVKYLADWLVG